MLKNEVNKLAYIIICILLGGAGIHKFYARKWIQGIIYICLLPTGISVILSVFDLIIAICEKADEQGRIRL